MNFPKKIMFGHKPDWSDSIESQLSDVYEHSFSPFPENTDLSDVDLIIPLTIQDQINLHNYHSPLNGSKLLIPSLSALDIADDKIKFNQFLISNRFGKYVPKLNPTNTFPYVLKRKKGEWGEGTFIINSSKDERKHAQKLDHPDFYTQEFISGRREYTTHIFYKNEIAFHTSYEFIYLKRRYVKGGGNKFLIKRKVRSKFNPIFSDILKKLNYEGVCCFNFKIRKNIPMIFEMNARYGASLIPDVNEIISAKIEILNQLNKTVTSKKAV